MDKIVIAIDGHSSTGKSTVAKSLAAHLGYIYVDSGSMYRAITLYALRMGYVGGKKDDFPKLIKELSSIDLEFRYREDSGASDIYLNGENVADEIRTMRVSEYVSQVSEIAEVRKKLVAMQRKIGRNMGIVMDGRDIGTVVFPKADLKIFLTASVRIRALRRYKELLSRGDEVTFEQILKNVKARDYLDSHRDISPLKKAKDAIVIDNSNMGLEEQLERVIGLAEHVLSEKKKDA